MTSPTDTSRQLYRIWIAAFQDWQPGSWRDVPPRAIALEPAEEQPRSAAQAQSFLEGFNTAMLAARRRLWAVAVPVTVRYEGDGEAGQVVGGKAEG